MPFYTPGLLCCILLPYPQKRCVQLQPCESINIKLNEHPLTPFFPFTYTSLLFVFSFSFFPLFKIDWLFRWPSTRLAVRSTPKVGWVSFPSRFFPFNRTDRSFIYYSTFPCNTVCSRRIHRKQNVDGIRYIIEGERWLCNEPHEYLFPAKLRDPTLSLYLAQWVSACSAEYAHVRFYTFIHRADVVQRHFFKFNSNLTESSVFRNFHLKFMRFV